MCNSHCLLEHGLVLVTYQQILAYKGEMYFLTGEKPARPKWSLLTASVMSEVGRLRPSLQQEKSITFPWNLSSKPIASAYL